MVSTIKKVTLVLTLVCLFIGIGLATSRPVKTLQRLLAADKNQHAYHYAEKMLPSLASNPEFDLQYGVAAVRVKRYGQAIFAFKRVLAAQPGNLRARVELARAQFFHGEQQAAKTNFDKVLAHKPPKKVKENIKRFLKQIDIQKNEARMNHYFVEFATGYDTNVNSAAGSDFIDVPALGEVQLDSAASQKHDQFIQYIAGMNGHKAIKKLGALFWSGRLSHITNPSHQQFNTDTLDLALGYGVQLGNYNLMLPVRYQQQNLENHPFRRSTTVGAELSRLFGKNHKGIAYVEHSAILYPTQRLLDTENVMAALSLIRVVPHLGFKMQPTILFVNADASSANAKYNGYQLYGALLKLTKQLNQHNSLEWTLGHQASEYARDNPLYGKHRRDEIYSSVLDWKWRAATNMFVDFSYGHYKDHSNSDLYSYTKNVSQVAIKYFF